jgi:hypothetical protein
VQGPENSLIGRRVKSLKADVDHDEDDRERSIPPGSWGTIGRLNHVDGAGELHCDVFWDNGGWTIYSQIEVGNDLHLV